MKPNFGFLSWKVKIISKITIFILYLNIIIPEPPKASSKAQFPSLFYILQKKLIPNSKSQEITTKHLRHKKFVNKALALIISAQPFCLRSKNSGVQWRWLRMKVNSIKWSIHLCVHLPNGLSKSHKKENLKENFSLFPPEKKSFSIIIRSERFTRAAEEHLAELMPIFEQLRAQGDLPCTYPLHMASHGMAFIRGGSRSTPLSPHAPHCHPSTHWVSLRVVLDIFISSRNSPRPGKKKCFSWLYIIYDFDICLCGLKEHR